MSTLFDTCPVRVSVIALAQQRESSMRWCFVLFFLCLGSCFLPPAPLPGPAACGNGIVDPGEECDEGKQNSGLRWGSTCLKDCKRPRCGDGTRQKGEDCDDGNTLDDLDCAADCQKRTPAEQREARQADAQKHKEERANAKVAPSQSVTPTQSNHPKCTKGCPCGGSCIDCSEVCHK